MHTPRGHGHGSRGNFAGIIAVTGLIYYYQDTKSVRFWPLLLYRVPCEWSALVLIVYNFSLRHLLYAAVLIDEFYYLEF